MVTNIVRLWLVFMDDSGLGPSPGNPQAPPEELPIRHGALEKTM